MTHLALEPTGTDGFKTLPGTDYAVLNSFLAALRISGVRVDVEDRDGTFYLKFPPKPSWTPWS